MRRLFFTVTAAALGGIALGQTWDRAYHLGLSAAKTGQWERARWSFLEAAKSRHFDVAGPSVVGGEIFEPRKWRGGAPYSPNFLAAYAGLKLAEQLKGDARKALLETVGKELETLLAQGQACRETFFFLDEDYLLRSDTDKRLALGREFKAVSNLGWHVDAEAITAGDRALLGLDNSVAVEATAAAVEAVLPSLEPAKPLDEPRLHGAIPSSPTKPKPERHNSETTGVSKRIQKRSDLKIAATKTPTTPKAKPTVAHDKATPAAVKPAVRVITAPKVLAPKARPITTAAVQASKAVVLSSAVFERGDGLVFTPVGYTVWTPESETKTTHHSETKPTVVKTVEHEHEQVPNTVSATPVITNPTVTLKTPEQILLTTPPVTQPQVQSVPQHPSAEAPSKAPVALALTEPRKTDAKKAPKTARQAKASKATQVASPSFEVKPQTPKPSAPLVALPATATVVSGPRRQEPLTDRDNRGNHNTVSHPEQGVIQAGSTAPVVLTPIVPLPNKFALVIGNSESKSDAGRMPYAADDAQTIRQTLVNDAGYLDSNVELVLNGTAQQIAATINALASRVGDKATVFIYFAGTGANVDGKDYLAGVDTESESDSSTMIAKDDVYKAFMLKGARIFAFFEANRPIKDGHFFGSEVPLVGSIAQMQATLPGDNVYAVNSNGKTVGLFTNGLVSALHDIHSNQVPILDFGWQVFYKLRRGDTGMAGGSSNQSPSLPVLTNMASDARF